MKENEIFTYAIKIVLISIPHAGCLLGVSFDEVIKDVVVAIMSPHEIACNQSLELGDVGEHRVGPVEEGSNDEPGNE